MILPLLYVLLKLFRVGSFRFIKLSLPQSLTADGAWTRSRSSPSVKDQGGESYSSVNLSSL